MHKYLSSYLQSDTDTSPGSTDVRLDELEAIIASISDGLVIADAEGHLLAMNPAGLRLHQYESMEEARMHVSEYAQDFELRRLDGTVLPVEEWPMTRVVQGEHFTGCSVRVHRRDTDHVWIGAYSGTPIRDEDGVLKRAVLTIRDITPQKRAEYDARQANAALSKRVAELNAVLESIPDAVYIGTATGIEWANSEALEQLGYKSVEELNRHIAELADQIQTRYTDTGQRIPPEDEGFARALSGETFVRDVIVRHLQSGEDRILRSAAAPVRVDGDVVSAVAVNTDITERVRAKDALREAKERAETALQSRDEVLAVVSHDLRSLLSTVLLGSSMIQQSPKSASRYGRIIEQTARQMHHLIDDLLDVACLKAGRSLPIQPEVITLADVLQEGYGTLAPQLEAKGVRFDGELPAADCRVHIDSKRILQVITNLIGNALKFVPEGGQITVRVDEQAHAVAIAVCDTGPGIAQADQERIFKPFWKKDDTARDGAGLGLPIARGIVERHGGDMRVSSTPGEGATFTFTLPRAD